ncbi:hypothetical protein ACLOJK_019957 [Asimina triloba]
MELTRREKNAGIKPDEDLNIFMKALASGGEDTSLIVEYKIKLNPFVSGTNNTTKANAATAMTASIRNVVAVPTASASCLRLRAGDRPIRAGFIAVVHLKSGKRRERSESDGTSLRPVPTACNGRATLGRVGGEGKSHLERSHGIQPGCCCCHQEEGEIVSLSRASSDLPLALVVVSSSCSPASHRRQGTPSPGVLPLSPCFHPSPLAPPPSLPGSLSPLAVPPLSPPISPSPPPSSASLLPVPPPAPPKTYLSLHSLSPLLSSSARPSSLSPRISPSSPPSSLSRPLLPLRHFLRSPLLPLSPDPSLLRLPPPSLPRSTPSASLLPPPSLPIYALRLPPPSTPSRPLLPLFSSSPCSLRLPPTPPAPCSLRFSSSASLRPLPPPALSALLSPPPAPPLLFLPLFPSPPALSASLPPPPSASLRPLPPPAPPLLFLPLLPPPPSPCSPSSPPSPCSPSSPPPPAPSALSRLLLPLLSSSAPCSLLPRSRSTPSASRLPPPPPALAHFILKERLHELRILGCVMCIARSVVIVIHAPQEKSITSAGGNGTVSKRDGPFTEHGARELFLKAVVDAGELVWNQGLLKLFGICHDVELDRVQADQRTSFRK